MVAATKYYKTESKKDYWISTDSGGISDEKLVAGSLMRIADATELMAKNHIELQNELERNKRWFNQEREYRVAEQKTNSNLKGQITKLKKALLASQAVNKGVIIVDGILND
jgi:hypothetical protein